MSLAGANTLELYLVAAMIVSLFAHGVSTGHTLRRYLPHSDIDHGQAHCIRRHTYAGGSGIQPPVQRSFVLMDLCNDSPRNVVVTEEHYDERCGGFIFDDMFSRCH
jgi:hypothetical protein